MPEPIRFVLDIQLELLRQYLLLGKRWLDLWGARPAVTQTTPAVVVPLARRKPGLGCIGPADLRG